MGLHIDAVDLPGTRRQVTQPLSGTVSLIMRIVLAGLVLPPLIGLLQDGRVNMFGFGLGSAVRDRHPERAGARTATSRWSSCGPACLLAGNVDLCANHPTLGQRLLVTLTQAPRPICGWPC